MASFAVMGCYTKKLLLKLKNNNWGHVPVKQKRFHGINPSEIEIISRDRSQ
jgi:hypothetical protein